MRCPRGPPGTPLGTCRQHRQTRSPHGTSIHAMMASQHMHPIMSPRRRPPRRRTAPHLDVWRQAAGRAHAKARVHQHEAGGLVRRRAAGAPSQPKLPGQALAGPLGQRVPEVEHQVGQQGVVHTHWEGLHPVEAGRAGMQLEQGRRAYRSWHQRHPVPLMYRSWQRSMAVGAQQLHLVNPCPRTNCCRKHSFPSAVNAGWATSCAAACAAACAGCTPGTSGCCRRGAAGRRALSPGSA